jgi:hypothetical protein
MTLWMVEITGNLIESTLVLAPRHGFELRLTASFTLDLDCSVVHQPILDPFLLSERWEWMTRLRPTQIEPRGVATGPLAPDN